MSVFILFLITYIKDSRQEMRPSLSLFCRLGFGSCESRKELELDGDRKIYHIRPFVRKAGSDLVLHNIDHQRISTKPPI